MAGRLWQVLPSLIASIWAGTKWTDFQRHLTQTVHLPGATRRQNAPSMQLAQTTLDGGFLRLYCRRTAMDPLFRIVAFLADDPS
jgi:hypothetical protein